MTNLAFVFPGQGSQSVGMLRELALQFPSLLDNFTKVSEALGLDVWQLIQEGPESRLNQTEHTQVAMLTADVAIYNLLQTLSSKKAKMMAGHSLGEYAALVCAEALSLTDAAKLVAKRGQLMQDTVPLGLGAMAAIVGLTDTQVEEICSLVSTEEEKITPANFNSIGQVVIAGHTLAIEKAIKMAEEKGARMAKIIPVSVPCHCPLLMNAAFEFEEYLALAHFKEPEIAVVSNVDLSIYKTPKQMRTLLKEQLVKPVRWVETIQLLQASGMQLIIECGPAKVLSGLIKRIDKSLTTISVNDPSSLEHALSHITASEGCCH